MLLFVVALPATAQAATVSVDGDALRLAAAAGETNRVTVTPGAPGTLAIVDTGAPLSAAGGCVAEDGLVVCGGATRVEVELGDGDDELVLSALVPADVTGGAGNDLSLIHI